MGNKQDAPTTLTPAQANAAAESVRSALVGQAVSTVRAAIADACNKGRMRVRVNLSVDEDLDQLAVGKKVAAKVAKALQTDGFAVTVNFPLLDVQWGDAEPGQ